ncbi:L-PSP endoribonuclease family protein Brt1 [Aspergillus brunneoviolaceus CBS 621.78]|uniref:L-PSP endoribonuclease family protein Brt1 n=1 Tax=Aspergillus brunneoviolaceus CBS 621.78 TaxID=1450534 RepID=A0ACD1GPD9_9EURO|nr:L-PSP endoribonuclease family protein Brt1 [Aspergillus brunneoviolaceus CBS 621.78]RAH51040.1 L-PSP endoribonuclease family protein Brt1 [Aspergillus brunneoviolaceus CBS 621.78]
MWHPTRRAIHTRAAPAPPPFLSQAIVANNTVHCSGQIGVDPATGELVKGSVQARAEQILRNLRAVLEAAGSSLDDVVKVNIFLTDMGDFGAVNEVYIGVFGGGGRARTCVAVKSLPMGTDVEIECSAVVRDLSTTRGAKL